MVKLRLIKGSSHCHMDCPGSVQVLCSACFDMNMFLAWCQSDVTYEHLTRVISVALVHKKFPMDQACRITVNVKITLGYVFSTSVLRTWSFRLRLQFPEKELTTCKKLKKKQFCGIGNRLL